MRIVSVWREWESGDSLPLSVLRIAVLLCGLLFLGFTALVGLPWPQQTIVALLTVGAAIWLDRSSSSYVVTLTVMLLSMYSTVRYGFWRVATAAATVRGASSRWDLMDACLMVLLLAAECYAFVALLLGYMQTVWPLRRTPVPLPDNTAEWPAVDVLIPTLNEPLDVVRFTVLAALNMDWPADKLNVYLLDDGRRAEFREFARQAGAGYLTRQDNRHGKAGNLNSALEQVESPFVVVFDADHVPTRSFLQVTTGWFLRDARLGILQTPHHFYSPDPFERNLGQFHAVPNEDELFYGVLQDGNDFWNATYFCGSCAVLRRSALDEAGGLATETVTEDAHTSMRMQRLGWNSAYINIPQAAGLATERLSAHVRQRIRWARGMVQILRIENPMLGAGLTFAQRLCYLNAMSRFLYALPRLIFLTAPLMYLIFGFANIPGYWAAILAYAAPHLLLSRVARSRMQGRHRHSFWTDIFETVLAPWLVLPTLGALLRARRGPVDVTPESEESERDQFDSHMARPTLVLLACNWFGLCCAAPRLMQFPSWTVPGWAGFVNWPASLYDPGHAGVVGLNAAWTVFNLVLLGVALGVAWESRQRRRSVRVETQVPAEVVLQDGSIVRGVTADLSSGGVRTTMEYDIAASPGDYVEFVFPLLDGTATLPGRVVSLQGRTLRARFDNLTLEQYEALTIILYARADRWLGWGEARTPDRPVRSFLRIVRLALWGLRQAFFGPGWREENAPRRPWLSSVVPVVVFVVLFGFGARSAGGAQGHEPLSSRRIPAASRKPPVDALVALVPRAGTVPPTGKAPAPARPYQGTFTLAQAGVREPVTLRGTTSRAGVSFALPQGLMVKSAVLRLRYRFSPQLLPGVSSLRVSLNGTPVATIPVIAAAEQGETKATDTSRLRPQPGSRLESLRPGDKAPVLESAIALPAELLGRANRLTFEFAGRSREQCADPTDAALWGRVDTDSSIAVVGSTLTLEDNLGLLPAPFFDAALPGNQTVQIAFPRQPSFEGLRAAGIVASWIGTRIRAVAGRDAGEQAVRFAVSVGTIPAGNVIVLAEGRAGLPDTFNLLGGSTFAAMRTNPADGAGKVLVLSGGQGDELVLAAVRLARSRGLRGAQADLSGSEDSGTTAPAGPYSTNAATAITFVDAYTADLDGDGSQPAQGFLRLPADLYLGQAGVAGAEQRSVPLHLRYRYDVASAGEGSALEVWANGEFVRSVALPHTGRSGTANEAVVPIPAAMLKPFANTLTVRFAFQPARSGGCAVAGAGGFRGSIGKDSYLDLDGIPRWTELPNLRLFSNAGFPFTREPDLGNTTVILPDEPSAKEVELFLSLLSHFGAETGRAATGVSVTGADGLDGNGGKHLLVLGKATDQPVLRNATVELPASVDESGVHTRAAQGLFSTANAWLRRLGREPADTLSGALNEQPEGVIEQLEWPRGSKRAMVVVALRDDSAAGEFVSAFERNFERNTDAGGTADDVAVLKGGAMRSYRVGAATFSVGSMPLFLGLELAFGHFPWVIAVGSVIFCFLMASLLRTVLRRSARVRLQGNY